MRSSVEVTRADVDRLYKMAFSRRMEKSAQLKETGIGALGGAGLGALLGYLTPRDKDEDKTGRYLRYILGGAAMGGLAGLGIGASKDMFGSSDSESDDGNSGQDGQKPSGPLAKLFKRLGVESPTAQDTVATLTRGLGTYGAIKLPRGLQEYRNSSWRIGGKTSPHRFTMPIEDISGTPAELVKKELNPFLTGTQNPATIQLTKEHKLPGPIEEAVAEGSKIDRLAKLNKSGLKGLDLLKAMEAEGLRPRGSAAVFEVFLKSSDKNVRERAIRMLDEHLKSARNAERFMKRIKGLRSAYEFEQVGKGEGTAKSIGKWAKPAGWLAAILPLLIGGGGESTVSDSM